MRGIQSTAVKKDGYWVLSGGKIWISLADMADNFLVFAWSDQEKKQRRDASVKYASGRKTFGMEICRHQLVKELIAQMESDYQAARPLWLRSGRMKNQGRRNTREIHKLVQADYLLGYRTDKDTRCTLPPYREAEPAG